MKARILIISLALALAANWSLTMVAAQDAASVKIIINKANAIESATSSTISNWFLKKVTRWNDGTTIQPVDLTTDSPIRETFTREIHGKSIRGIKSYWQKQIFSGQGTPPSEKASEAEVIAYVIANPGAVAYVSATADTSGVKVLEIE